MASARCDFSLSKVKRCIDCVLSTWGVTHAQTDRADSPSPQGVFAVLDLDAAPRDHHLELLLVQLAHLQPATKLLGQVIALLEKGLRESITEEVK